MLLEIVTGIISLTVIFYFYVSHKQQYWKKKGVFQVVYPFWTIPFSFIKIVPINVQFKGMATAYKEKLVGMYFVNFPMLLVQDVELVRQILVKDFDSFVDRNSPDFWRMFGGGDDNSKLGKITNSQMINVTGDKWKDLRSTFSPIFTGGRLKAMIVFMEKASESMVDAIKTCARKGQAFELKDMLGKYSMDTIASCAFGVEAQSYSTTQDSLFIKYASTIFTSTTTDMIKAGVTMIPGGKLLMNMLGIHAFKTTETQFFYDIVMSTLEHRRNNNYRRNDLVDMMMDAIKDDIKDDNDEQEVGDQFDDDANLQHKRSKNLDELSVVATCLTLLAAGYDTVGTTLAYTCYQLAKDPDIQDQLRAEVEANCEDGITYESIQNMPYLDQVIAEVLRFYCPIGLLARSTTKDYKIPGHNVVLDKGTMIMINVIGIHFNEEFYPNPEQFNPDNFSKENKAKRSPYAYLPFGQGPRNCFGMRFALVEAKLALANIVLNFNLLPSDKTKEPLVLDPDTQIAYVKNGLWIKAEIR
jgi:cytochrome P450